MAAGDHRVKQGGMADCGHAPDTASRSRPPLSFKRSGREDSRTQSPEDRAALPSDDARSLIQISTACIACFEFDIDISASTSASELVESIYNVPSRCVEANLKFALFSDKATADEMIGLPLSAVLPQSLGYERLFRRWHACSLSGQSFEVDVVAPDSSPLVMQSVVYARIVNDNFSRLWVVFRDVTVHARAVQALARAELHYRSLVERPGLMLVRFRPDGWYEYMSPSVHEILGYSIRDFNAHPRLILELVHPEDIAKVPDLERLNSSSSCEPIECEFRLRLADGSYHWFFSRHSCNRSLNGDIEYIDLLCMDIQRHKELEEEVAQRNKATLVGQTAAGIAHDLNNYLTVIHGQVEVGIQATTPDHPAHQPLLEARLAISACADMARQLLDVGRCVPKQRAVKAVASILQEIASLAKHLLPRSITLHVEACDHQHAIECSPSEMQQALLNIILNARDALNGSGVIILRASPLLMNDGDAVRRIAIRVRDNGSGIAPEFIERIFEPYFTTKTSRGGTGLGLSNVKSSIESQGGSVVLRSTIGVGTELSMVFPLVAVDIKHSTVSGPQVTSPARPLSVLVADDEEGVRNIILANLGRIGHKAYGVSDGPALIAMLQESTNTFDAIIVDDSMPKVRGLDLIERLRELSPGTQLILTSGDPRIRQVAARLNGAPIFLAKPFGLEELSQVLAQRQRALAQERPQNGQ
jgi:two-component system cell cycle sensor histidine kinase/response regulator CckA